MYAVPAVVFRQSARVAEARSYLFYSAEWKSQTFCEFSFGLLCRRRRDHAAMANDGGREAEIGPCKWEN